MRENNFAVKKKIESHYMSLFFICARKKEKNYCTGGGRLPCETSYSSRYFMSQTRIYPSSKFITILIAFLKTQWTRSRDSNSPNLQKWKMIKKDFSLRMALLSGQAWQERHGKTYYMRAFWANSHSYESLIHKHSRKLYHVCISLWNLWQLGQVTM